MKKQMMVLVLVIALVLMVGVQAYQIDNLKDDIADGTLNIESSSSAASSVARSSSSSGSGMVGGC